MTPAAVVREWIDRFNAADVAGLVALYAENAINHQVVTKPLEGRAAIREMFEVEFGRATMVCVPESLHEAGARAAICSIPATRFPSAEWSRTRRREPRRPLSGDISGMPGS